MRSPRWFKLLKIEYSKFIHDCISHIQASITSYSPFIDVSGVIASFMRGIPRFETIVIELYLFEDYSSYLVQSFILKMLKLF